MDVTEPAGSLPCPGGLLVVFANILDGKGHFGADGGSWAWNDSTWGELNASGSGGGSVNIFVQKPCDFDIFSISANGGKKFNGERLGGNGTVTCTVIINNSIS